MQLQDVRERYNLKGSCIRDCCKSYYCRCCSLIQAEKESKEREVEKKALVEKQYVSETMTMEQSDPPVVVA
jgi:hypothetical protein